MNPTQTAPTPTPTSTPVANSPVTTSTAPAQQDPSQVDYSKATFNAQYQAKMPEIKQTVQQLRTQGIGDDKIMSYLVSKGVYQIPPTPTQTDASSPDQSGQVGIGGLEGAAKNVASDIGGTFKSGIDQIEQGGNEIAQGGVGNVTKGVLSGAAGALNAATSPITGALSSMSNQLGVKEALTALKQYVTDPAANAISKSKALQNFMMNNPDAEEVAQNLITIGATFAGGKAAPEAASSVVEGVDTAGQAIVPKKISTGVVSKAGLLSEDSPGSYASKLKTAQNAIYPKLSSAEKAEVPLKDTGSLLHKKSVPDLTQNSATKGVLESVANLPDDIQIKGKDTLAMKDSKIQQGISRLHSGTDGFLSTPEIKAATTFEPAAYEAYMKENVLDPVESEYGKDSAEYKAYQDTVKTSSDLLKSNDAHGVYTARQALNAELKSRFRGAFKNKAGSLGAEMNPTTNARILSGQEMGSHMNNFIEEQLPENSPYRARLREESNLIRARQEMRSRTTGDVGSNKVKVFARKHPIAAKIGKGVANAAKIGEGVNLLSHL